ncbi:MAG: Hsp20/alpha crystallin family protein [Candidatus Eisenbacteria bacterium]|uniref:Hsp20/alpha crystallin family protein n=1 Tax=Eiseniibacteriota bacterium TaxID=2212470 RepID=A0A538T8G0_UNCEI|nr:MAG: Hsp20/alpha crystallin family protein [Candidatus Eisenbacteria bacterium]
MTGGRVMKSVVRWNPIRDFASVQDEMNRLMGDVFGRPLDQGGAVVWQPPIDIEETPESYRVHVELPGMRLEDIKITLEDNRLTIRGEKSRTAVNPEKIEATYRDGVLEVTVPKAEEAKAREIPIKVAR